MLPINIEKIYIRELVDYLILVVALIFLVYILFLIAERIAPLLQIRILNFSLAVSLIPLMLISFLGINAQRKSFEDQMKESLKISALSKAAEVDNFFSSTKEIMRANAALPIFRRYLSISPVWRPSDVENELYSTIDSLKSANILQGDALSFGLLNAEGLVEYDSYPDLVGLDESQTDYFRGSFAAGVSYVADIVFPKNQPPEIVFASPVTGEDNEILGILRARYSLQSIDRILRSETVIYGDQVYPIVIDYQYVRLVDTLQPNNRFKPVISYTADQINQLKSNGSLPANFDSNQQTPSDDLLAIIDDYKKSRNSFFSQDLDKMPDNTPEIGVAVKLTSVPWYLIYPQTQTNLLKIYEDQNRLLILYIGLIGSLIAIVASMIAQAISNPILSLTRVAEKVTSGDLNAQSTLKSNDEIGSLSIAFNSMTAQLNDLIQSLEDRVNQRTEEISKQNEHLVIRSQQLKTISEVASSIAATQDIESLLTSVTHLISERFGYYHIGVFLLDDSKEYAVLRAANSEGGQRMLKRNHRLRVGQVGIVGYATGKGEPRIATDVGEDSIYFNNPDLPLTRSEMALPLKINREIIGALDVQSKKPHAFTPEDTELFEILADQLAIAIMNNNLYEETNRALDEMRSIHQRYLRNEWAALASYKKQNASVHFTQSMGVQIGSPISIDQKTISKSGMQISSHPSASDPKLIITNLTIPIVLRGETIAFIRLSQQSDQEIMWSDAKIKTVTQIADQIALTLESARLLEQTLRRAERERKALNITNRIRSTNNFQEMIQIAVEEIKHELNVNQARVIIQEVIQDSQSNLSFPEKISGGQSGLESNPSSSHVNEVN
jgi:GAF domain-containing protein/HAMP domain-containing protein